MRRFWKYPNGWATSIVQSDTSQGMEIALLKVRPREKTWWEKLKAFFSEKENKTTYYESKLVLEDIVKHPNFNNGVYEYLTPDDRREICRRVEALEKWKEW